MKSSLIVGALFLAYVFYVAAKGTLPNYLAIFMGTVTPGPAVGTAAAQASGATGLSSVPLPTESTSLAGSGTVGAGVANSDITDTSFGSIPDSGDVAGEVASEGF